MGWFGPKQPIDQDELEWQLATFQWLMQQLGGLEVIHAAEPFIPDEDNFPVSGSSDRERASQYFDHVRRLAGMDEWPCRLEAGEEDRPVSIVPGIALVHHDPAKPLGTFSFEAAGAEAEAEAEAEAVIRYHPRLVREPAALIATFAHELCHYLIHGVGEPPPGGWELDELATDLATVFLGFGIFTANNAKSFAAFASFNEMGWEARRSGYLSEAALVTAIAIRERLAERDPLALAGPYLKPHLRTDLKNADAWLGNHYPDMPAAVAALDLEAYFEPGEE